MGCHVRASVVELGAVKSELTEHLLPGQGLELSISWTIIEAYGGKLWATTNEGKGATFHFTLPTTGERES